MLKFCPSPPGPSPETPIAALLIAVLLPQLPKGSVTYYTRLSSHTITEMQYYDDCYDSLRLLLITYQQQKYQAS